VNQLAKRTVETPGGEIIAKFENYEEAVAHVEKLLSGNFPVRQIAIVGRGIRTVERTRGRITYARLAINGAIQGAIVGAVLEYFTTTSINPNGYISNMVLCAGIAMTINILRMSLSRNKRTFTATSQLLADTYEIQIPRDLKAAAEDALAKATELAKPKTPSES
jgi:hypothetical protein